MSSPATQIIMRLAVATSFGLVAAGCGSGPTSIPSAPSTVAGLLPTNPPVSTGPYSISGVVTADGQPIARANVNAFVIQDNFGYSYMWAHGAVLTDAEGRYRMPGLPAGVQVWFQVYMGGYVQQCASAPVTIHGDLPVDLGLVSTANLSASTTPLA